MIAVGKWGIASFSALLLNLGTLKSHGQLNSNPQLSVTTALKINAKLIM